MCFDNQQNYINKPIKLAIIKYFFCKQCKCYYIIKLNFLVISIDIMYTYKILNRKTKLNYTDRLEYKDVLTIKTK